MVQCDTDRTRSPYASVLTLAPWVQQRQIILKLAALAYPVLSTVPSVVPPPVLQPLAISGAVSVSDVHHDESTGFLQADKQRGQPRLMQVGQQPIEYVDSRAVPALGCSKVGHSSHVTL
jgi:hypothetical protein